MPAIDPAALDAHFAAAVGKLEPAPAGDPDAPVRPGSRLTGRLCLALFDAQAGSRHLDFAARELRGRGEGFYTIGSAGHEGNAAVAAALRPSDPALLHYRSGGFYLARAGQVPGSTPLLDVLLGVCAAAGEPIAGGRHKVFGHPDLAVIPQTSTVASHLPRAVGVAFAIERARRLEVRCLWPGDAVAVCSFGDATVNHSTAAGAFNTAEWVAYQRLPLPLLLVCEDNGFGISVRTPAGWVEARFRNRPGLRYMFADGCDIAAAYDAAHEAVAYVRTRRRPLFLHLGMVRFLGHAGSDVELGYRTAREMNADLERDPLVATARLLVDAGAATPSEVLDRYEAIRAEVSSAADQAASRPRLASAGEVMAPLARAPQDSVAEAAARAGTESERIRLHGGRLPEERGPMTLAEQINAALADGLASHREMLVFGEDVAHKGGVYGVTRGLLKAAGPARVFDSLLDEQSILGLALGAGLSGLLPVPEVQYLAYLHNAEDQLRGEAATLGFFSCGAFTNPMVVRIASYAYQKGFGGHFHNDHSVAVLRDIPGVVVASPSRPEDAAAMLRTCLAAAATAGTVCVFLEPIALYHVKDLHEEGDGAWLAPYEPPARWAEVHAPIGSARTHGDGSDLTIVTFGNGLYMSLRVARRLGAAGISPRVVDLRWLSPLPAEDILRAARATGRVLVVDETRRTGGVSEALITALVESGFEGRVARVASEDSFVPLGDAAQHVLVSEAEVEKAALGLLA